MKNNILIIFMIALILIVLGIAGEHDRQERERASQHYIEMVKAGAWPDYKGILNEK